MTETRDCLVATPRSPAGQEGASPASFRATDQLRAWRTTGRDGQPGIRGRGLWFRRANCQYGMYRLAGPGLGAWRELAANMIVPEGVLAGEAESFPLLYHWRVLPGRPPVASEHVDIDAVVAQFGGAPAVRVRCKELAGATSSLVLFLEYVPYPLLDWLTDPVDSAERFERQLLNVVALA